MNSEQRRVNARFQVKVIPRSPREEFAGVRDSAVVVRLTAAPVNDAANQALVKMLSRALDVPARDISIIAGSHSRDKTLRVAGLNAAELEERLRKAGAL